METTDNGLHRGFGQAYIEETTGLTAAAIGHAIENSEETIDGNGEIDYVVGKLPTGERVLIGVYKGVILTATTLPTLAETIEKEVPEEHEESSIAFTLSNWSE